MNDELRALIDDEMWEGAADAAAAYWSNQYYNCDLDTEDRWYEIKDEFEEAYSGEWDSFRQYIEETCCEIGLSSGGVDLDGAQVQGFFSYIDWDQVEVDWNCSGEWFTAPSPSGPGGPGGVYVFRAV